MCNYEFEYEYLIVTNFYTAKRAAKVNILYPLYIFLYFTLSQMNAYLELLFGTRAQRNRTAVEVANQKAMSLVPLPSISER